MDINKLLIDNLEDIPQVEAKTAVVLPDGRSGFLYPSGTIKDDKGRFLVQQQPGHAQAFDRDTAREAVKKREAIRATAFQQAIIDGAGASDLSGGVEYLAKQLVEVAKSGQGRDKIQAVKELVRHAGLAGDLGRGGSVHGVGSSGGVGLDGEAVRALNVILPYLRDRITGS